MMGASPLMRQQRWEERDGRSGGYPAEDGIEVDPLHSAATRAGGSGQPPAPAVEEGR